MAWNCQAKGENTYRVVHTHDRHARIIVQQLENGRQSLGLEISELKKKKILPGTKLIRAGNEFAIVAVWSA